MTLLAQFLLRLSFGLALGMAVTSPRQVSSGYFRNLLYVTLGLTTLAALVAASFSSTVMWLAAAAAVSSYVASVCWLYESARTGVAALWGIAALSILAAWAGLAWNFEQCVAATTSGLLLGLTMAAMLLGHWYLNSPGMELAPLRRLLVLMGIAVLLQAIVSGVGIADHVRDSGSTPLTWWLFVTLRWLFGIVGVAVLVGMAWQTLKIPNTQSATGILYVAVIGSFVGELTALLLSAESAYPL